MSDIDARLIGMIIQANKAVVSKNAFSHEFGINQDGVLKHAATYEIITPEMIGLTSNVLFLGKHSGRHAFTDKVKELGYDLSEARLKEAFQQLKVLTDHKKEITDDDFFAFLSEVQNVTSVLDSYKMDNLYW